MYLELKARGGQWQITGSLKGERVRQSTGLPLDKRDEAEIACVELELEKLRKKLGKEAPKKDGATLADCIDLYLKGKSVSESTRLLLNRIKRGHGTKGAATLTMVEMEDMFPGVQAISLKRYLTQLRAVMRRAKKRHLIPEVPEFDMPSADVERVRYLSAAERKLLNEKLTGHSLEKAFRFLLNTGARPGEIVGLTDTDVIVRGASRQVVLTSIKGGKTRRRAVPLNDVAWAQIEDRYKAGGHLFINGTKPYKTSKIISQKWRRLRDELIEELPSFETFRLYDARHDFATNVGGDLDGVQRLLGHSNIQQTTKYRHVRETQLEDAVNQLPEG